MHMDELSRETALFKHPDAHVSGCAFKVRLNLLMAGSLTVIALMLWLTPPGTSGDSVPVKGTRTRGPGRPPGPEAAQLERSG